MASEQRWRAEAACTSSRRPPADADSGVPHPHPLPLLIWGVNFGSEEKARDAVLYHYKHAASGFSAKLTAEQVEDLKRAALKKMFSTRRLPAHRHPRRLAPPHRRADGHARPAVLAPGAPSGGKELDLLMVSY
ncbi:hypothetical protein ZWY2020_044584 [Hordeum vulgare]|nr:hypothetical protein ZWY2020_044584 [Hordeum vulgare]